MAYPVTASQIVAIGQAMNMPFRPAAAGLINVVVIGTGFTPLTVATPSLSLRLELFPPGATSPALSKTSTQPITHQTEGRIVVSGDAPALATQLAADWTVKVTNTGNMQEKFVIVVRYQTIDGNLGKIDHVVVLMMENRSFDHMLGYRKLSNSKSDVDGLAGTEFNRDAAGTNHLVQKLAATNFTTDPGHGWTDVAGALPGTTPPAHLPPFQLSGDPGAGLASNAGFVQDFAQFVAGAFPLPPHDQTQIQPGQSHSVAFRPSQAGPLGVRSLPLQIPTQAHSNLLGQLTLRSPASAAPLASQSAPIHSGAISMTYTVTPAELALAGDWSCEVTNNADTAVDFITDISNSVGSASGSGAVEPVGAIMGYYDKTGVPSYDALANQFMICDRWFASIPTDTFPNRLYAMTGGAGGLLTTPSDASVASNPPGFPLKTIFEVLQEKGINWNIFFSDLPFALVFKALAQDAQFTSRMRPIDDFLTRAETGDLPAVTWLDPNFNDVPDGTDNASDDHPPGDVARGQQFVSKVFNALAASPSWSKTLLVITYDEHGGFYDHVQPPGTPPRTDGPKDDDPNLTRYGLRVPAFVVSPWVPQGQVSHTTFDHTSILRSVLLRFCASPISRVTEALAPMAVTSRNVPSMGARTDNANDLGPLLDLASPRTAVPIPPVVVTFVAKPQVSSPLGGIGATIRRGLLGF